MTIFRFIRRLLLCSLVGVTFFGVSGWLLRPRPNWEVEIPPTAEFAHFADARAKNDPILLSLPIDISSVLGSAYIALAPDTGELLTTFRPPAGFVFRREPVNLPDGRLLATAQLPLVKEQMRFLRTWFGVLDLKRRTCERECLFEGEWEAVSAGDCAWKISPIVDGFKLVLRSLSDGTEIKELAFPKGYSRFTPGDVAVSPDGRFLVICESSKQPPGVGFEVWSVENKKLIRRIDLPKSRNIREPLRAASPQFLGERELRIEGRPLSGEAKPYERWTFDVERLEFVEGWSPAPPSNELLLTMQANETRNGATIWTAYDLNGGPFGWFSVYKDRERIRDWRRVPISYEIVGYGGLDSGTDYGMRVHEVPGRDEFVALIWQRPLEESIPEFLHGIAKRFFEIENYREYRYWHDWNSGAWIDIGCHDDHVQSQVRENAFLRILSLLSLDVNRWVLQSWPLPPRDPKWPALGFAVASAAAVWWLCARRARRKKLAAA